MLAAQPGLTFGPLTLRLYTSYLAVRGIGSALIESDPTVGFMMA
ncbi:hypothetical protein [Pseudogemmobacter sonorensis]